MATITRIRVVDVPETGRGNEQKLLYRQLISNIIAGVSPNEALEVEMPNGLAKGHPSCGGYIVSKINKAIKENKYPVDCFRRVKDGKWYVYVVGR